MRSIPARIERIEQILGAGKPFDGCSMEDLAQFGFTSDHPELREKAPQGVLRAATAMGLVAVWCALNGRDPVEAAEWRYDLNIDKDTPAPLVLEKLVLIGRQQGLPPAECDWLKREITYRHRNLFPSERTSS